MEDTMGNRIDESSAPTLHHHHHTNSGDYAILFPATSHYNEHCHQYDAFPPPLPSDGAYHRVFDDVERRLQQEEQQQHHAADGQQHLDSYHEDLGHQHSHYTPTTVSTNNAPYSRIVSNEGTFTSQYL
jgi:hypothetical protein